VKCYIKRKHFEATLKDCQRQTIDRRRVPNVMCTETKTTTSKTVDKIAVEFPVSAMSARNRFNDMEAARITFLKRTVNFTDAVSLRRRIFNLLPF